MSTKCAADLLAERLYAAGIRHAFGMPGGEVLTVMAALSRAGIAFTLVKHENAAGFMAEAVWQRTGRPAILLATIGPGVLNGINTIANAHQDRVPMLVLAGCVDEDQAETYTHQVLDHRAVLAPITKAQYRLHPETVEVVADKALDGLTQGRPGPVFIDVPIGAAAAAATAQRAPRQGAAPVGPAPGPGLDQACQWLAEAQRPVMIVGVDAVNERAEAAITAFAQARNIPVITTYKAKGVIDEADPLCLGAAGLSPLADTHLVPFVQSRDLILCVGYDPIEMRPGWQNLWSPSTQRVVEISAALNTHGMHQSGLQFVCDIAAGLAALSAGAKARPAPVSPDCATTKLALAAAFAPEAWGPGAVIEEVHRHFGGQVLASVDSGAHRILLSQQWQCSAPRSLLQSAALCTMGCAVPLGIGTALIEPEAQVVAFSGDAGFLMVAGELATAAEHGLKPIFVVFVDRSLALIEMKQRQRQLPNLGVDFADHDFAAIGRAFGGQGVAVSDRAGLRAALAEAQQADCFTVIAAQIDRNAYDGRI